MAPAQASPLTGEGSRRHKPILSTLTEKLSAIASPLTIEVSSPLAIDDLQNYWHPSLPNSTYLRLPSGPSTSTPTHPDKDFLVQMTPQNGGGSARADAIGGGLDPHLRLQTSDFAMALCCDEFNSSL